MIPVQDCFIIIDRSHQSLSMVFYLLSDCSTTACVSLFPSSLFPELLLSIHVEISLVVFFFCSCITRSSASDACSFRRNAAFCSTNRCLQLSASCVQLTHSCIFAHQLLLVIIQPLSFAVEHAVMFRLSDRLFSDVVGISLADLVVLICQAPRRFCRLRVSSLVFCFLLLLRLLR